MDSVIFRFGNIEIKWYSMLILVAVFIGIALLIKEGKRFGMTKDFLFNMCFWAIITAFIGARIYYVIFNWNYYSSSLSEIYKVWNGGLAIHGGLLGGFIAIILYCKKYNISAIKMTDMMVIPLLLGQAIGRWGNFFNSEAYGAATSLTKLKELHIPNFIIEGMNIGGFYYHPTFLYESLWCLLGVIILVFVRRNKYLKIGHLTSLYFIWYSFGRFFIEYLRQDSLKFGAFKTAQIVSMILFVIALLAFMILTRKGKFEDLYNEENPNPIRF